MRRLAPLLTAITVLAAGLIWLISTQPTVATASVYQPGATTPGSIPPQFRAQTLGGQQFDLVTTRGHPVILNFFATWCTNCRFELPLLEQTYQQSRGSLDIVTVDFNDTGDIASFVGPFHVTFPVLLDPTSAVGKAYQINDLPVSVFIAANGRVTDVFHGQLSQATIQQELQRMNAAG